MDIEMDALNAMWKQRRKEIVEEYVTRKANGEPPTAVVMDIATKRKKSYTRIYTIINEELRKV